MWNQALAGVRKHLVTYSKHAHLTIIGERPSGLGGKLSAKMDHLVCFMPGTIALSVTGGLTIDEVKKLGNWGKQQEEQMRFAAELTKTCWGMYQVMATRLAPEISFFEVDDPLHMDSDGPLSSADMGAESDAPWRSDYQIKRQDMHNLQRPETVESFYYMWRITGDQKYREWGWEMFRSFEHYTAADDDAGFTSLANANEIPPILRDNMESFWLAETLKYFYLLFSPADFLPLKDIIINTEAHIFPRFKLVRGLKTGWKRKPRDEQGRLIKDEKVNDGVPEEITKREMEGEKGGGQEANEAAPEGTRQEIKKVELVENTAQRNVMADVAS
jgi:endoplasmic reticulum Man9GlcNAc2 1,2-alpha-mannosidase